MRRKRKATTRRKFTQYIVTIDGHPVAGTNAHSRAHSIAQFIYNELPSEWFKTYKPAGYVTKRVTIVYG